MKYTRRKKNRRTKRGGINFGSWYASALGLFSAQPQSNEGQLTHPKSHPNLPSKYQLNLPSNYQTNPYAQSAQNTIKENQLHSITEEFTAFLSQLKDMPYSKLIPPVIDSSTLFCKDNFNEAEKSAFDQYQGGYYSYINHELRTHSLDKYKETVKTMVTAMLSHPLKTPLVVYRGSVGKGCKYNVANKTITDDGFFSTTLTETVSMVSFSNSRSKEMCVMEISVPEGTPHAHLRRYIDTREEKFFKYFDSSYSTKTKIELENEVVFPPGMTIQITGKKTEGVKTYLQGIARWDGIDERKAIELDKI
jgi:hypothetical protein